MQTVRIVVLIFMGLATAGCGPSLRTADLTHRPEFRDLVGKEFILYGGEKRWVLINNPYDPLSNFSEGNVLFLADAARAEALASGEVAGAATPVGPSEVVGLADGASIVIEQVHQYGMETHSPVVLGRITMPGGRTFPFESEWSDTNSVQIRPR